MCRRMIYLVYFVLVLALVLTNFAQADLIGYWKNDESSGTIAADSAGGDNDGILFGDQLDWTAGRFGGALSHGGVWDAGVEFLTRGMSARAGTVAMWGLLADPQPAHTKYFFGHTTQQQWTNRVQLYMDEGDNLLDIGLGNSHTLDTDILELPMEEWLHVALTWDSGRYVVYMDGEEVSSGAYGGLSEIYPIANIGNDGSSWPYEGFAGLLDEVRLYDHALNAAEILAAMEGVSAPTGADIILVTEAIDWDMDGLRDDHSLESFLASEGHSVDVRPDYWKVLDPDKIAELNMADLIIFSRLAWSYQYIDGDETIQWNSLTTPLLQMSAYFARNIEPRWNWVNSNVKARTPHIYAEAVDPHHPIFRGVLLTALDPSDPDSPLNVVQMIDPLVGTGHTSFIGGTDMGNGHLIAKPVQLGMGWIAEWDVGVEFYEGAGQYAGGRRMLFCAGTQEIQFLDPDTQEVMTTAQGELNLTAEGLQMFRNAIDYLLKPRPEFTEGVVVVEDFETEDFGKFPWSSYGDESWETTRSERHSGYYGARSGSIEDGEETTLEVSIDCVSGYITFYCKVSSESGFDKLTFYIDGLEQDNWSGQEDWAEVYFHVREGTRTFKWAYSKDSSVSEGDDSAWIDDIVFPIGP